MGNRQSRPWLVSDELWSRVGPLLPKPGPKKVECRPRVPDRQGLCGILVVLHTGIQWEYLPQEPGLGSGMTCRRRLAAWNNPAGPAPPSAAERAPVEEPAGPGTGDHRLLARAGCPQGPKRGPSPVDRARPGSTHHLIVDGQAIPLAVFADRRQPQRRHPAAAPARQDPTRRRGRTGRARRRPDTLLADRDYDHDIYRRLLRQRCCYLDVPFETTLLRHATKPDAVYLARVTQTHLRDWYRGKDMLPNVPETVIDASSTLEQTVGRIMRETGLDRVPVVDR
jgi:hypothetical protein